jgi:O-antigen/teichoic acid export membrane protein
MSVINKIVTQNVVIMIASKSLSFALFLYIAKVLSQDEYGSYIYVLMVLSLLPLFQFGSRQGATILLPKTLEKKGECEEELFSTYSTISLLIQSVSGLVLFFLDLGVDLFTVGCLALTLICVKLIENAQLRLNSKLEMGKSNVIKAVDQISKPIFIFLFFSYYNSLASLFWGQLIAAILALTVSLYYIVPHISLRVNFPWLKRLYSLGFFIYLIWAVDIVFRAADRWFIAVFYSNEELAGYGFASMFAMNIWVVALVFIAPYAQVMYKSVAEGDYDQAKELVFKANKKIYILLLVISLISIFIYPFITQNILGKYSETYELFLMLVVVSIFLSINNMYIYFMNASESHYTLLRCQFIVLVVNIILNALIVWLSLDIIYFGGSTAISLVLYFVLVKKSYNRQINIYCNAALKG